MPAGITGIFDEGDALYAAMLRDIGHAVSSVRLELYLLADDEAGQPFIDVLCSKAGQGVEVRVRIDTLGSLLRLGLRARLRMRRSGVRLRGSPRPVWRQWINPNRRNHRKLLVVDDRIGYLGGFNIHRECSRRAYGAGRWRDLQIRFEGDLVKDAAEAFDTYGAGQLDWQPHRQASALLIGNHSRQCRFRLYCRSLDQIARARQRIWIASPYFVPNHGISAALRRAVARGVDVRVQVPAHGDVPLVRWATALSAHRLARAGVRVYRYLPRMNHAKAVLVDNDFSSIGTANIDYRSLFINDELNLLAESKALNRRLAVWFEAGFAESTIVEPDRATRVPRAGALVRFLVWRLRRWL